MSRFMDQFLAEHDRHEVPGAPPGSASVVRYVAHPGAVPRRPWLRALVVASTATLISVLLMVGWVLFF